MENISIIKNNNVQPTLRFPTQVEMYECELRSIEQQIEDLKKQKKHIEYMVQMLSKKTKIMKTINFEVVTALEEKLAKFFGATYAICLDSCTHGIELCLRYTKAKYIECPKHTYLSVPFLANKLNIELKWKDEDWKDFYYVTDNVIDAAVLWKKDSYIPNTFMSISFQYQKHLNLGRGGVILTDNKEAAIQLKKMSYDGRLPNIPWRDQNIEIFGFHYYMTPETAQLGIDIFEDRVNAEPRQWKVSDWPDLTEMDVFKKEMINKV